MRTAAPKGGGADVDRRTTGHRSSTTGAAAVQVDLPGLRERLVGARRRLVERLGEDFPPDRRFPDSGWTWMLADIEIAIMAVDAVLVDDGGAP